jgi:hypothetical protein
LLCKPSRDEDSRKTKGIYANWTDIYENRILGLYGIAQENGRKKEKLRETDKEQEMEQGNTRQQ